MTKSFVPTFFNHFSWSLNKKKTCGNESRGCGNESREKETRRNHASAADLLHIKIANLLVQVPEIVTRMFFVKKVFLKILPNAQENTCFKRTLSVAASEMRTLQKRREEI